MSEATSQLAVTNYSQIGKIDNIRYLEITNPDTILDIHSYSFREGDKTLTLIV